MLIDLNDVLKNDEKVIEADVLLTMDTFVSGMGEFPIVSKNPVSLKIQNKGEKELLIKGDTVITGLIPCSRCLHEVEVPVPLHIERSVKMDQEELQREAALNEHNYIKGYNLDVDKLVYGEMLLNWPMKVLCSEDCKGICNKCGANLNLGTCGCDFTELDPRMAKIRDVFSKFKEV